VNTSSASPGLRSVTALIALLALVPVTAETADLQPDGVLQYLTKKVSLSDLDLTTDQGFQIASERIHQTARRLCAQVQDVQDLGHQSAFVRCVDRAMASASAELSTLAHRAAGPELASIPPKHGK
jgi:UrcA family protein